MHLGMGLVCGSKIKDLIRAGFDFTIFLADWHSLINNKLGGNMDNIRTCGEYFKECFTGLGIPEDKVKYVWASDLAGKSEYWEKVVRIAKTASLQRIRRTLPIMGRSTETTDIETAALFYPCMQAADIFQLELDVACAGIDQRKAHALARDAAERLNFRKPTCIHTHLLVGLQGPMQALETGFDEDVRVSKEIGAKMSKSMPGSCIFVHDSPEEIREKIGNAYCPPKETENNPVLELAKYVVLPECGVLRVVRSEKYGGEVSFSKYDEIAEAYREGKLHPLDLKNGVAEAVVDILQGVRNHFKQRPQLLDKMNKIDVTR